MSDAAVKPDDVRAAFAALADVVSVTARRVGAALVECLDWRTWTSPDAVEQAAGWTGGVRRKRVAGFCAYRSPRSVSYGLRELEDAGFLFTKNRTHMSSWYRLNVGAVLAAAAARRSALQEAAVAANNPAEASTAPASIAPASMAPASMAPAEVVDRLAWAEALVGRLVPDWARAADGKRPRDLAVLALVYARECWGAIEAERLAPTLAKRLARLWRGRGRPALTEYVGELLVVVRVVREHNAQAYAKSKRTISWVNLLRDRTWSEALTAAASTSSDARAPDAAPRGPSPAPVAPPPAARVGDWLALGEADWAGFRAALTAAAAKTKDAALIDDVRRLTSCPPSSMRAAFARQILDDMAQHDELPEAPPRPGPVEAQAPPGG